MNQPNEPIKRKRGFVLNAQALRRLKQAIEQAEALENNGNRYTTEDLSKRTGVSLSTISRLWAARSGVDKRTLRLMFSAFGLELTEADIYRPGEFPAEQTRSVTYTQTYTQQPLTAQELLSQQKLSSGLPGRIAYPSGPVPLNSPFYIPRPPLEERACAEIAHPGCTVRIKAPSGFGKSSLLLRVLARAEDLGFAIALIDLLQAEPAILSDAGKFLRWFCGAVALKLGKSVDVEASWSDILGNALSTTVFIREQILATSPTPVLLSIKEFNCLFAYPATAQAFLPLLRSWYEEASHDALWQQLRQVVTYATDSYLPLDINQSPFNIGLPILLPTFTAEQVSTLARLYNLSLSAAECDQLMALVGGHPELIRIALYHLSQDNLSLNNLARSAVTPNGIFHNYLQQMLVYVQDGPEQLAQLRSLVMSDIPVSLDPILAYQLEGTGLIKSIDNGWIIEPNLYREYFRRVLFGNQKAP
ncbi:MAG: AAA-like domain-containing protein [Thainema sp.]